MDGFIHRENLRLFRKRLENQCLSETERKIILRLLAEEQAKIPQSCRDEGNNDQTIHLPKQAVVRKKKKARTTRGTKSRAVEIQFSRNRCRGYVSRTLVNDGPERCTSCAPIIPRTNLRRLS
jgi:hypothetical protein